MREATQPPLIARATSAAKKPLFKNTLYNPIGYSHRQRVDQIWELGTRTDENCFHIEIAVVGVNLIRKEQL